MKESAATSLVHVCFIGFNPAVENKLKQICKRFGAVFHAFTEAPSAFHKAVPKKVDVLILDDDDVDSHALSQLFPAIVIGGPGIMNWGITMPVTNTRHLIIQNAGTADIQSTLAKILATHFRLKALWEKSA